MRRMLAALDLDHETRTAIAVLVVVLAYLVGTLV